MSDVDGHYLNELETGSLKKELLKKLIYEPAKLWEWDFLKVLEKNDQAHN